MRRSAWRLRGNQRYLTHPRTPTNLNVVNPACPRIMTTAHTLYMLIPGTDWTLDSLTTAAFGRKWRSWYLELASYCVYFHRWWLPLMSADVYAYDYWHCLGWCTKKDVPRVLAFKLLIASSYSVYKTLRVYDPVCQRAWRYCHYPLSLLTTYSTTFPRPTCNRQPEYSTIKSLTKNVPDAKVPPWGRWCL